MIELIQVSIILTSIVFIIVSMVTKPSGLGAGADAIVTVEQIRKYDSKVSEILGGANMLTLRQMLGVNYDYDPGIVDFQFKTQVYPFSTKGVSKYGVESMRVKVEYLTRTQKIIAIAKDVEEVYKDIASYKRNVSGKIDILGNNVAAAAHLINWDEDYNLFNGNTDQGLYGFLDGDGTTVPTDIGAPTGAWDDPTDIYADFPKFIRRLRRYGFTGPVKCLTDPFLFAQAFIGRMLDDGTNYYDASVLNWALDMMAQGRFILSPYPFVNPVTSQSTSRAIPELSAGANHLFVAGVEHPDNHVAIAEDVKGFKKPAVEGDIARLYREFVSIKMNQPRAWTWMNAIDETT